MIYYNYNILDTLISRFINQKYMRITTEEGWISYN